jgi:hypothetical protein
VSQSVNKQRVDIVFKFKTGPVVRTVLLNVEPGLLQVKFECPPDYDPTDWCAKQDVQVRRFLYSISLSPFWRFVSCLAVAPPSTTATTTLRRGK